MRGTGPPAGAQSTDLPEARKRQADIELELEDLKRELNSLRATVEDDQELTAKTFQRLEALERTFTQRLNDLQTQMDQQPTQAEEAIRPAQPTPVSPTVVAPLPVEAKRPSPPDVSPGEVSSELERAYREGYEAFQAGDLDGAQKKFGSFLREHPDTPLSDNAQFWIGEIYFRKHQYEAAILAYEEVIKKYPHSNKLPDTLLKQGLAFLELGDKIDARIILENLIKKYPNTEQAKIAKNKLQTLN